MLYIIVAFAVAAVIVFVLGVALAALALKAIQS
jgi:hypothetical protein